MPEKNSISQKEAINILAWIKKHSIILSNVLIVLVSLIIAVKYYYGTISAGDAIYTFSMHGGDYGDSPVQLLKHWYLFINGRITQALFAALLMVFSYFSQTPEAYPWWIISWIEIFCVIATPVNLVIFFKKILSLPNSLCILFLGIMWSFWSLNDIIYAPAHMHQSVEGYYLPVYLLSIAFLWLLSVDHEKPNKRFFIIYTVFYLGLSMVGEQFFPSIPVLFLSILLLTHGKQIKKGNYQKIFLLSIFLTIMTIVVFFAAPGQHIRSQDVSASFGLSIFSVQNLVKWFVNASSYGYDALFHWSANLPYGLNVNSFLFDWEPNFNVEWLFISLLMIPLFLLITGLISQIRQNSFSNETIIELSEKVYFRTGLLAFVFHFSYLLIMSTLLISDYFPLYAIIYPSLLLISGLCLDIYLIILLLHPDMDHPLKTLVFNTCFGENCGVEKVLRKRSIVIILSGISGLLVSFAVIPELLTMISEFYKIKFLLLYSAILAPVMAVMIYLLLFRWTLPLYLKRKKGIAYGVVMAALIMACYSFFSLYQDIPLPSVWYDLTVIVNGEKNPASQGNEIWLRQIEYGDGYELSLDKMDQQGEWKEIDGYLVSSGNEPSSLKTNFRTQAGSQINVLFSEHASAGIVVLDINGKRTVIDLYDKGIGGDHIEVLSVPGTFWRNLLSVSKCFDIFLFYFILFSWLCILPSGREIGESFQHRLAVTGIFGIVILFIALSNWMDIKRSYQVFNYTQQVRHLTYQKISDIHNQGQINKFYLINCPAKSYYNHYGFDSPWGVESSLLWRGLNGVELAVDQDVMFTSLDSSGNYFVIECEYPDNEF